MADKSSNFTVGSQLTLRTVLGDEVSAEVFAYDGASQTLVLKQPGSNPKTSHLRVLREGFIEAVLSATPPAHAPDLELPHIDMTRAKEREDKAVKEAEVRALRIGHGVSRTAQAMFDALAKTMPCRWDGKTIVVLEEVRVSEPYAPEHCSTKNPKDTATLDRVQKVLEAEQQRAGSSTG